MSNAQPCQAVGAPAVVLMACAHSDAPSRMMHVSHTALCHRRPFYMVCRRRAMPCCACPSSLQFGCALMLCYVWFRNWRDGDRVCTALCLVPMRAQWTDRFHMNARQQTPQDPLHFAAFTVVCCRCCLGRRGTATHTASRQTTSSLPGASPSPSASRPSGLDYTRL